MENRVLPQYVNGSKEKNLLRDLRECYFKIEPIDLAERNQFYFGIFDTVWEAIFEIQRCFEKSATKGSNEGKKAEGSYFTYTTT